MKLLKLLLLLILSSFAEGGLLFSQKVNVASVLEKYPLEPFVYLNKSEKAVIKINDAQLSIISHDHEELLILKNNLVNTRSLKVRTSEFASVDNIKAYRYVYDGDSHKKVKLTSIELRTEHNNEGIFFDDNKYYFISFSDAKEGDIIYLDYDTEYKEPMFFGIFFLSDYHPSLQNYISIEFPRDQVKLKHYERNYQKLDVKSDTLITKKSTVYSYSVGTSESLTEEYLDPGFRTKSSFILVNIENYIANGKIVEVGGTLNNLYKWYTHLVKNVDLSDDIALLKLTDSLTKDKTGKIEKIKSIYSWIQNNIAYLGYEDGLNGFIPREASVVFKQKFGDCKDMGNLIAKMGQIAGLPTYRAWIGTRDIPYQFSEFPAPFCANHMIAVFISNNDTIYLDATGKYQPFLLPTSMIQGKEAFIGINDSQFVISRVPYINKEKSMVRDSVLLKLKNNNIISGRAYYSASGYEKIKLQYYLEKKSYNHQMKYLKSLLEKGNNKFKLDTFIISPSSADKPLLISYNFTLPDYATKNENFTYINLNFSRDLFDKLSTSKRKYPVDLSYKNTLVIDVSIELDPNQVVDFIPENLSQSNSILSFSFNYKKQTNKIEFNNTVSFDQIKVSENEFEKLETIINQYKKNKSQVVSILSKN